MRTDLTSKGLLVCDLLGSAVDRSLKVTPRPSDNFSELSASPHQTQISATLSCKDNSQACLQGVRRVHEEVKPESPQTKASL